MKIKNTHLLVVTGIATGAIAGFVWQHFNGCDGGNCMITSSPVIATLYGAVTGGLFLSLFTKEKQKTTNTYDNKN